MISVSLQCSSFSSLSLITLVLPVEGIFSSNETDLHESHSSYPSEELLIVACYQSAIHITNHLASCVNRKYNLISIQHNSLTLNFGPFC